MAETLFLSDWIKLAKERKEQVYLYVRGFIGHECELLLTTTD